jgi:hypothetical protein
MKTSRLHTYLRFIPGGDPFNSILNITQFRVKLRSREFTES